MATESPAGVVEGEDAQSQTLGAGIDPTTFAVLTNRYFTTVEEMTYVYERAAASPVIALARDFSCAIYGADGRLVAMRDGTPMHVTGMHMVIRPMIAAFADDIGGRRRHHLQRHLQREQPHRRPRDDRARLL